ncbi:hypothetical protein ACNQFZ_00205 [Schinkia sp. CFF1]
MKNMKIPFVLTIIIFIIIFIVYNIHFPNQQTTKNPNKIHETVPETKNAPVVGTTLGLFDENTALSNLNTTFILNKRNSFQPSISIHNRDIKENLFRLLFVLDYEQADIQYNNNQVNYIDILLKPGEEKKVNIELNNLSNGMHDFIVFSIRRPDDPLSKPKFFPPGHFNVVKRTTLIVGNQQSKNYISYKNLNIEQTEEEMPLFVSIEPRKTIKGEIITRVGQEKFPLWINFSTKINTNYAILTFNSKTLEHVEFYRSKNKGVSSIPFNFTINKSNKNENLFIALIENPFTIFDEKSYSIPWDVQTTNRITVINN